MNAESIFIKPLALCEPVGRHFKEKASLKYDTKGHSITKLRILFPYATMCNI